MQVIEIGKPYADVSPTLFGLFLEDINWACDGGLNANMVRNYSFDDVYLAKKTSELTLANFKIPAAALPGRLRYWNTEKCELKSCHDDGVSTASWYARVQAETGSRLMNLGYNGGKKYANSCGMAFTADEDYQLSCYIRSVDFSGVVSIYGADEHDEAVTTKAKVPLTDSWVHQQVTVHCYKESMGKLVFSFEGKGSIDLDCVVFHSVNVWGKEDPKWSQTHLRADLVETLRELKPKFLRFPGGCIVEGLYPGNEYQWKQSIGQLIDRMNTPNLWGVRVPDRGYSQSYQIGFYEYFCLCEDLGAKPLPVVWAGLNCQMRSKSGIGINDEIFQEKVIQNALDLIAFANAAPEQNPWAKIRAEMGHPEPFRMDMIAIGNENFGPEYLQAFLKVKNAIDQTYPGIRCILSSGPFMGNRNNSASWDFARKNCPDVLVDEHFYEDKSWLYQHSNIYDSYDRNGPKLFLGEYAASSLFLPHKVNTAGSALSEAAFLTGVEKNADLIEMASYAPLLCMGGGEQWTHNLIFFNARHVMKTANYYVQKMYSSYTGKKVLSVHGELPKKVYYSATEDEEYIYFKIVNASSRSEMKIQLRLPCLCQEIANVSLLAANSSNDANEIHFTGKPIYRVQPKEYALQIQEDRVDISVPKNSFAVITFRKKI